MTDKAPLVSVVIPTYNRSNFVTKAIDSVLNQFFTDYEIIVIDDGSTDQTREVLKAYEDKIRYIYQVNSGVSAARNTGISVSHGKWVAFLDSDDEWKVDYLSKQIKLVSDYPETIMQIANCIFIGIDGTSQSYFDINGVHSELKRLDFLVIDKPFRFVIKHGPWQVGSTLFRRDAIISSGLFDTNLKLSEDFDLMARMALHGPVSVNKEELVNIYRRDEKTECLTNQARKFPIQAREGFEKIFKNLKGREGLNDKDHETLNELLSANRRAIGNILLKDGDISGARVSYKKAVTFKPSIASLGKYALSFFR